MNVAISRRCFAEDGTDLYIRACRAARAARLFFDPRPIRFLIYGVGVAFAIVDAKTPYSYGVLEATTATPTTTTLENNDLIG